MLNVVNLFCIHVSDYLRRELFFGRSFLYLTNHALSSLPKLFSGNKELIERVFDGALLVEHLLQEQFSVLLAVRLLHDKACTGRPTKLVRLLPHVEEL